MEEKRGERKGDDMIAERRDKNKEVSEESCKRGQEIKLCRDDDRGAKNHRVWKRGERKVDGQSRKKGERGLQDRHAGWTENALSTVELRSSRSRSVSHWKIERMTVGRRREGSDTEERNNNPTGY